MFAVIRTGGKQYRVAPNDIIEIERIAGEPGDIVELGEVLLLGGDGGPQTGSPTVAGALVAAELVEHIRGEKIIVFKKKRRKNYRRKNGHRQTLDHAPHHGDPDRRKEAVADQGGASGAQKGRAEDTQGGS